MQLKHVSKLKLSSDETVSFQKNTVWNSEVQKRGEAAEAE